MKIIKEVEDRRGKIIFCSNKNTFFNIVEIKKGFSRGGHYHSFKSDHVLINGKIEVREKQIDTNNEKISVFNGPFIIIISENIAHLFTAIEDSIFIESFGKGYDATNFPEYREIVEKAL